MTTGTYASYTTTSVTLSVSSATITSTGTIDTSSGVAVYGGAAGAYTLVNDGTATDSVGYGVEFAGGGSVTNGSAGDTTAVISGYAGLIFDAAGTVANFATIAANGAYGTAIQLQDSSTVTNGSAGDTVALISGFAAINIGGAGTVTNYGTIAASGAQSTAVLITSGGSVANGGGGDTSALISGGNGVYLGTAGTVTNDATIAALSIGIELGAGGVVSNAASGTIVTTGYSTEGVKLDAGGSFENDGIVSVDMTAAADAAGSGIGADLQYGGSLYNTGTIELVQGTTAVDSLTGVMLGGGGSVTNTGLIAAGYTSASALAIGREAHGNGPDSVKIGSIGIGVDLDQATLTNNGVIEGGDIGVRIGVAGTPADGTVVNSAAIRGGEAGLVMYGGTVANSGVISGSGASYGAGVEIIGGTLGNSGTIDGTGTYDGYGIYAKATAALTVTNEADGLIQGETGVEFTGSNGDTLINAGSIDATGATAVAFGGGNDLLQVEAGGYFTGLVSGGAGTDTLELSAGAAAIGTLSGLGVQFTNFEAVTVDSTGTWALTGDNTIDSGAALTNAGTLAVRNTLTIASGGALENDGLLKMNGGTLIDETALGGTGTIGIISGGTADLQAAATGQTVDFLDNTGVLQIGDPAGVTLGIAGFVLGDKLDLTGVTFQPGDTVTYGGGQLYLFDSGQTLLADLHVMGLSGEVLGAVNDGAGNTAIEVVCFLEGTRIRTARGEVAVEDLSAADRVVTASGRGDVLKPVKWIGRRRTSAARHPHPEKVYPIRIKRGAFAPNLPVRDLLVSPGHAIHAGGVLIPAHRLVNGVTILQDLTIAEPLYFHIELDEHDVLLAEGLGAESYLDSGNRGFFQNGGRPVELHALPDGPVRRAGRCAPLKNGGPEAEAVKRALLRRVRLLGYVPARRPELRLVVDGEALPPTRARRGVYRFDLPSGYREVWLMSATTTGGATRSGNFDARRLGVAVSGMVHGTGAAARTIDLGSRANLGAGWYPVEQDGSRRFRWTDGAAILPVTGAGRLEITLLRQAERWLPDVETTVLRRRARRS